MFVWASLLARFRQATGTRWTKSPTNSPWPLRPRVATAVADFLPQKHCFRVSLHRWFCIQAFNSRGLNRSFLQLWSKQQRYNRHQLAVPSSWGFCLMCAQVVVAALFAKTSWSSMWIWSCQQSATSGGLLWKAPYILTVSYFNFLQSYIISLRSQSILLSFWNNIKSILTAEHLILLQWSRQPFDGHTPCFLSIKPTSNPSSQWKCCPNSSVDLMIQLMEELLHQLRLVVYPHCSPVANRISSINLPFPRQGTGSCLCWLPPNTTPPRWPGWRP